jgi:hypothetical protein
VEAIARGERQLVVVDAVDALGIGDHCRPGAEADLAGDIAGVAAGLGVGRRVRVAEEVTIFAITQHYIRLNAEGPRNRAVLSAADHHAGAVGLTILAKHQVEVARPCH